MCRFLCLGAALVLVMSCQRSEEKKSDAPTNVAAGQKQADLDAVLAKVDDVVITVGEFQDQINRQAPLVRPKYTSLEQKKDFLENLIRFEVLAKEGLRRNLDKDKDVVRAMKQVMIQKLMQQEFSDKVKLEDITEDEMKKYYEANSSDYYRPAEVRVSAIIVSSRGLAKKVADQAKGEAGRTNKGFRTLVGQYSIDEETKIRGGDLRYFAADNKDIPKAVVNEAFKLSKTGQVAGPIAAAGKFYIIKLTGRHKELSKDFATVKPQIQNRLHQTKRKQEQQRFISDLRKGANITINEKNFKKVRVDTSTKPGEGQHAH
jgi:peptidyl-prolyl cis-trans isomerase C